VNRSFTQQPQGDVHLRMTSETRATIVYTQHLSVTCTPCVQELTVLTRTSLAYSLVPGKLLNIGSCFVSILDPSVLAKYMYKCSVFRMNLSVYMGRYKPRTRTLQQEILPQKWLLMCASMKLLLCSHRVILRHANHGHM
jgi:hypothetical protein